MGRKSVPVLARYAVIRSMRGNRSRDTKPECRLRKALRSLGVMGYRVAPSRVPGRPDVAFTRWNLAVFVHGCFWHRCPKCAKAVPKSNRAFWVKKFDANTERDARKRRQLEARGWTVMEVWECEITRDPDKCALQVVRELDRIKRHLEADEDVAELEGRLKRMSKEARDGRA